MTTIQESMKHTLQLLEQHTAAIRIQAAERRRQGMRLRIDMYVWRLQQLCRRHLVRQEYAEKRRHATVVQKHFRGWRARQILKMLHEDVGVFVAKKKVAAHEDSDEKSRKVRLATLSCLPHLLSRCPLICCCSMLRRSVRLRAVSSAPESGSRVGR